ncbi:Ubiquitin hydrolase [Echinococcus granulosus]|uniref:Ubiquitin carboxyl-terminal hydrolase n=1 Tax=Echinococcus granulosus TaxID=6210 RepID=W6UQK4_ECHGR|nr:Ubiquitin hydrolase [Echinococcus granulosus]EUB63006.1 Ubiquitin hydrolase [Echinococcus granulosus]
MKPLYIAKSLSDLENMCQLRLSNDPLKNTTNLIMRLFKEASMLRYSDEERAFIFYARGLNLFASVETESISNISYELRSQYESAKDAYARLRERLGLRYEMERGILLLDKLPVCDDPILSESFGMEPKQFPGRWMPPICLHDAVAKGEDIFIIDVRSKEEYSRKKIAKIPQINLGVQITYGQTISAVEKRMDDEQRNQWKLHKLARMIVLLDRDSGGELIEKPDDAEKCPLHTKHPLKIMYDALVTYNAEKISLPPAVFLSGGFEEFEKRYPSLVSSTILVYYTCGSAVISMTIPPKQYQIGYPTVADVSGCISSTVPSSYGNSYLEPEDPLGNTKTLSYGELAKMLKTNESTVASKLASNEPSSKLLENYAMETSRKPAIDRSTKPQLNVLAAPLNRQLAVEDEETGRNNVPEVRHCSISILHIVQRSPKPQHKLAIKRCATHALFQQFLHCLVNEIGISKICTSSTIPWVALRRGLKNMGNTCYMNSTLQCLLHTPQLWRFFIKSQPFQGLLVQSFSDFVCEMSNHSLLEAYPPKVLKKSFDRLHPMFADGQQQDSHEFLMILLDSLHEEVNRSKKRELGKKHAEAEHASEEYLADLSWSRNRARDDSVILDWFNGQLLSTVRCLTCNRCSHAFDEFMYLSLSIQGSDSTDLMRCIEEFFKSEELSGENLWLCPQCKIPCEAVKTFGMWRLPEYLIIHLKRFRSYTTCEKIDSYVQFPLTDLNLSAFIKSRTVSVCTYDLYGVINHHGSVQSGHYTAFCFDLADNKWWNFNDSRVTELSEAEIPTRAAYVLFYKRSKRSTKTG